MKATTKQTIENFFRNDINVENLYVLDYIDVESIDFDNAYESIYDMINDNGGFNVEIIYYFIAPHAVLCVKFDEDMLIFKFTFE